jgi:hypothetical protein
MAELPVGAIGWAAVPGFSRASLPLSAMRVLSPQEANQEVDDDKSFYGQEVTLPL